MSVASIDMDVIDGNVDGAQVEDNGPKNAPSTKNWCFTLNNYTEEDEERIRALQKHKGVYYIYGREVGEQGTPHLQGFVSFPTRKRLSYVKKHVGQAHFSMARMIDNSIEYCKKEGDWEEFGERPKDNKKCGKRTDLESFKEDVKAGILDLKTLREKHSVVCARYERFVNLYIRDNKPAYRVDTFPLRPWQEQLNTKLNGPVNPREITFLVDAVGNSGKTWFFRYYEQNHPDTTQIILPGKKQDMAYVLREENRVVFFDCPKSKQGEYIQYDFLEEVKNGNVFSGKYECKEKRFAPPHVVVAMNEYPNEALLSPDRYNILNLS
jgi:hypothetical protein